MNMQQSHTAVVERNTLWEGEFVTEPYEVGWSHEAIFFVRILRAEERPTVKARVQISPRRYLLVRREPREREIKVRQRQG